MARSQAVQAGVVQKELQFDDSATFVREYQTNISHGGTFVPWPNPPPIDTPVQLTIRPPRQLPPVELEAVVVFASLEGVGLQFSGLDTGIREVIEGYVRVCQASEGVGPDSDVEVAHLAGEGMGLGLEAPLSAATARSGDEAGASSELEALLADGSGMPTAVLRLESVDRFLAEYEANLRHAGVFAPWSPPPAVDTVVRLILCPPYHLLPIAMEALVVFVTAEGVGLQLTGLDTDRRKVIEGYVHACRERRQADLHRQVEAVHASVPPALQARAREAALSPPVPVGATESDPPAPALWEGSLAQLPVAQLLTTLAQRRATGRLTLQSGTASIELYFQQGTVNRIFEQPLRTDHLLGEMLVKVGQLRTLDRQSALEQSRAQGVPLGQALVKRGILTVSALSQSLARQSQTRLYELSHWTAGRFSFAEGQRPTHGPPLPPAHPVRVLFRGKVDEYRNRLPHEVEAAESGFTELYVFRAENVPEDMSALGLTDQELRFWEQAVTGGYYLREIYPLSNLSRRHAHALMLALYELGMLAFKKEMAPHMRARKMREALKLKSSRMERDSLFNMLELHWMADDQDVQQGYLKVSQSYDCASLGDLLPPDVHEMSRYILKRAAEARDALSTQVQRLKYRQGILEPNQIRFSADLLDQQGDMASYRGDWKEAEHRFSHILEIEPGNQDAARKLEEVRARRITSGPSPAATRSAGSSSSLSSSRNPVQSSSQGSHQSSSQGSHQGSSQSSHQPSGNTSSDGRSGR